MVDDLDSRRSAKALDKALEHKFSSSSLIDVLEPRLGQRNAEQCSTPVLHRLLTSVTALEDWFAVLCRLLAIGVLEVNAARPDWTAWVNRRAVSAGSRAMI